MSFALLGKSCERRGEEGEVLFFGIWVVAGKASRQGGTAVFSCGSGIRPGPDDAVDECEGKEKPEIVVADHRILYYPMEY